MNELREKPKLRSVQERIMCCLRWYGDVIMNDERWPKIMLNYNVADACPRGRPKKSWLGKINNMKSLKINAELAFDRHK